MRNKKWKVAGFLVLGLVLLLGFLALLLYQNRHRFIPKVEEVTYLRVVSEKGTALVHAGILVRNNAPFLFETDSINYELRNNGVILGYGNQLVKETLPGFKSTVLDVRLFLDTDLYRKQLAAQQDLDSLEMEVQMELYIDPPLLRQQTYLITRTIKTAIPKAPAFKIDSFFVKNFSPEAGYTFQLDLDLGETNLPDLKIEDLRYQIRLSDSLEISGALDPDFKIAEGDRFISVPVKLKTAELVDLLALHLSSKKVWPYEAKVFAILKTAHPLFENTNVSVQRSGQLDTRNFTDGAVAMPSVKRLQTFRLVAKERNTFLEADLLIYNPLALPLYLDSATYVVRHKGKVVAHGGNDHEKTLPANGNQSLHLHLAVNNHLYRQLMAEPHPQNEIPLDVELVLHYNLKGNKPQQIAITEKITVPITEGPTFKVIDIGVRAFNPQQGARLLLKLQVENKEGNRMEIDDFRYRLFLRENIDIVGRTREPILIDTGTTQIEIPVNLSAREINLVAKGLIQGVELWEYDFSGKATVSVENTIVQETEMALRTSGIYNVDSKGSPDYMPELSKIDTLYVTIRYDTAWVHMYAAAYNTLPATINVSQLKVAVIHENDTIGKTREKLNLALVSDTNSFTWYNLGINFDEWEHHVNHHQGEDSMQLTLPVTLTFELENLGQQQVEIDMSTQIPTPASPVSMLDRVLWRGFSFRHGLAFDAVVIINNANSEGLTVKNINYQILLDNGVDLCGTINRTYRIPLGISEVKVPINLGIGEAFKLLKRQLFGPFLLDFKLNATATVSTGNPKLKDVYVIFENHSKSDLKQEKTIKAPQQAGL